MRYLPKIALALAAVCTANADDKASATSDTPIVKVAVRGTVTKSDGSPAAGSDVFAGGAGYQPERFQATARCDDAGKFELQVAADMYYLFVATLGDDVSAAQTAVVHASRPPGPLALQLAPGAFVVGTVKRGNAGRLAADEAIGLSLIDGESYGKLPAAQRLPNPTQSTRAIAPRIVRQTPTNKQGKYEFAVGAGKYAISATDLARGPSFSIATTHARGVPEQQRVDLILGPDREKFVGRVVLKSSPEQGVADAVVWGRPFAASGEIFPVLTDAEGKFATQLWTSAFSVGGSVDGGSGRIALPGPGPTTSTYLLATSGDGLLAGIKELDAGKLDAVIQIEPTASVRGRVVTATGDKLAGSQLNYGIRVTHERGMSLIFGGSVISDAKGDFTIHGLVPGWTYWLDETMQFRDHMPRAFRQAHSVTPHKAEAIYLGHVVVEARERDGPLGPPTLEDMIYREILGRNQRYPTFDERFSHKLRDAKISGRPILLMLTPNRKDVCQQFFKMIYDAGEQRKFAALQEDVGRFVLAAIDVSEKRSGLDLITPLLTRLKLPVADDGGGTFAILDPNAQLLGTKKAPDLSAEGRLDAEKLRDFLRTAPQKP